MDVDLQRDAKSLRKMDEKLYGRGVGRICGWMDGQMKGCVVG